jgi:hypothetical protein
MAEKDEQTEDQAFAEGFEGDKPLAALPEAKTVEAEAAPQPETEPKPADTPEAEEPEYVQVTKKDFERLIASANETDKLKQQLPKVFGTMGNLQQVVTRLQTATPAGELVEMSEEDAAEMTAEFPELAGMLRAAVNRVLKRQKVKGTGEPEEAKPATATVDRDEILKEVKQGRVQLELDALDDLHPDWRTIVGKLGDENEFRTWLANQPKEYQDRINSTQSAAITSRAIDKFKAAKEAAAKLTAQPQKPGAARTDRIRDAVQPKGTGGTAPGPTSKSAEDYFAEGFSG